MIPSADVLMMLRLKLCPHIKGIACCVWGFFLKGMLVAVVDVVGTSAQMIILHISHSIFCS